MQLIFMKEDVGYIENSCNIGCILFNNKAILIDSGLEDSVAKKIIKLLDRRGYQIKAVINTHSHADHCGGNHHLQNKLGLCIYAPAFEAAIIENPYLEPLYLSSGAAPLKEVTNKFLMAKPSKVNYVISKEEEELSIEEINLKVVPLLGHAVNQIGIAFDGVLFCGDALIDRKVIQKHKIPFNTDIDEQIKTLKFLQESQYEAYIPSHGSPMNKEELIDTVEANLKVLEEINNCILNYVKRKKTLEEIIDDVFQHFKIEVKNLSQYYLLKTPIVAHLNYLTEKEYISKSVENNKIYWRKQGI